MLILGIETSCDETSVAVLDFTSKKKYKILSNIVSSQVKVHAPFGGVVPHLAAREHEKNLPVVFKKALVAARVDIEDIDTIAVTNGPGLSPALWRGVNFAKELAKEHKKPLVPVNHVEAHIYSALLNKKPEEIPLPALALVVSGGHTQLILIQEDRTYRIVGETRDDAAGEAFDKVAKLLEIGYPGGPVIAKRAKKGNVAAFNLPRPMIHSHNCDFSFSGLKTSVLYTIQDMKEEKGKLSEKEIDDFCAATQDAIVEVLVKKTVRSATYFEAERILVGGGVSANTELQKRLTETTQKELWKVKVTFPEKEFYTDNAAPIAFCAAFQNKKAHPKDVEACPNLRVEGKFIF